jgi:hypothetical protein
MEMFAPAIAAIRPILMRHPSPGQESLGEAGDYR